jgi:hypothetical protein
LTHDKSDANISTYIAHTRKIGITELLGRGRQHSSREERSSKKRGDQTPLFLVLFGFTGYLDHSKVSLKSEKCLRLFKDENLALSVDCF